jgi:hypothetical protein
LASAVRQGRLGGEAVPALVPVEIVSEPAPVSVSAPQPPDSSPPQRARAGIIGIELGWQIFLLASPPTHLIDCFCPEIGRSISDLRSNGMTTHVNKSTSLPTINVPTLLVGLLPAD